MIAERLIFFFELLKNDFCLARREFNYHSFEEKDKSVMNYLSSISSTYVSLSTMTNKKSMLHEWLDERKSQVTNFCFSKTRRHLGEEEEEKRSSSAYPSRQSFDEDEDCLVLIVCLTSANIW